MCSKCQVAISTFATTRISIKYEEQTYSEFIDIYFFSQDMYKITHTHIVWSRGSSFIAQYNFVSTNMGNRLDVFRGCYKPYYKTNLSPWQGREADYNLSKNCSL